MKKTSKILNILLIAVMLISIATNVFAANETPSIKNPGTIHGTATSDFDTLGKKIVGAVQTIGSFASVIVLIVLGIKYMIGSAEEKAEYKKTMIPYIIGAVLVFMASNIAGFIYDFATTTPV